MAISPSPKSAPSSAVPPPPRRIATPNSPPPVPPPVSPPPPPPPPRRVSSPNYPPPLPPPYRSPLPATSPSHLLLSPSSPPPLPPNRSSQADSPTINIDASVAPSESPSNYSTPPSSSSSSSSSSPSAASPPPPDTSPPPPDTSSPPPSPPPSLPPSPPKNKSPSPVTNSPPPPLLDPPKISPPPPTAAPINFPPPITPTTPSPNPPDASPPPQSSNPPSTTSTPPQSDPPQISPPPSDPPSQNSPPSPPTKSPRTPTSPMGSPLLDSAPSPRSSIPPSNSSDPPSTFSHPLPLSPNSQPSLNSSKTPLIPFSPPPPSGVLSPPSPIQPEAPPSGITNISNPPSSNEKVSTEVAVSIGIVLGFLLLGAFGIAAWCMTKKSKRVAGMPTSVSSSPNTDSSLLKAQRSPADSRSASEYLCSPSDAGGIGSSRPWFTYDALVEATDGFSEANLLGEGGFGRVYKGHLPDGQEVAVKQLKIGGGQGEREFKAEVDIISRIHHRHLVSLAGYCISDSRRLLVYEYVPNNTLHFHLHGPDRPVMTWGARVKIAAGAARGIAYLHEDCLPRIIHRDIKSANILLDKNFEARVSDFGLAKLAEDANSHVTTRVMGTFGYMAPEYASSGKLTEKSDVFSFGVVLLELITGRKPVDTSQPLGQESLAEWARPKLSHALTTEEFDDLVDPRLEKNYNENEMFRAIEAAAACVRHSATKRPTMGQVVRAFEGMISADLTNGMRVGDSAVYNSAEQSAEIRLFRRMAFGQGSQDYCTDVFSHGSWHS